MKVLHVVDMIDPSCGGGTAERTYQLAKALIRDGKKCTVLCTSVGLTTSRRAQLQGVELIAVPVLCRRFLIPKISQRTIEQLVASVDVIHVMGHWSVLGARVCLAALKLHKPYVYSPAGSLVIFGRSALLKKLYNIVVGSRIIRQADVGIAVTALERQQFHSYGVADEKIQLLPNGVHPDVDFVPDSNAFRILYGLSDKPVILFLGRLNPIKGPDILLAAFFLIADKHPQAMLVIAGPEEELADGLKAEVERLGLQHRVIFTGFIGGDDKQNALAAADLLVVPSRHEAMSLVALEAGLLGTPVLLTDQCGFDEAMQVGGGVIVEVSVSSMAKALDKMLTAPEQLPLQGANLRRLVIERFTWGSLNRKICQTYERLLSARH